MASSAVCAARPLPLVFGPPLTRSSPSGHARVPLFPRLCSRARRYSPTPRALARRRPPDRPTDQYTDLPIYRSTDPPSRVGLRVLLPGGFSSIRWFGRGPHENYPDRKASAVVGRHASSVSEQLTPYVRPGECGGRTDVRWLELSRPLRRRAVGAAGPPSPAPSSSPPSGPAGAWEPAILFAVPATAAATAAAAASSGPREVDGAGGVECEREAGGADEQRRSSPLFSFSALPYLAEDLAGVMHPEELLPRPFTAVNLDHRLMGVGGDDSWSACVHDEYLVRPGRFGFSFALSPFWRRGGSSISGSAGDEGGS
ncbi:MAG: beta-galactosidase small subunit [Bacteroidota bacterium]